MAGSARLTMANRRTPDISPPWLTACRSGAHRIADRPLEIGWQRAVKADGAVAVDAEYDVSFAVQHLAVKAAVVSAMGDGEQFCLRCGPARHADKIHMSWQRHVPVMTDLPEASDLEARLRQQRLGGRVFGLRRVAGGHPPGEPGDGVGAAVPGFVDHLIGRAVEEHMVNVVVGDRWCRAAAGRLGSLLLGGGRGEPYPAGEVRRDTRTLLAGEHPAGAQRAVRDQLGSVGP